MTWTSVSPMYMPGAIGFRETDFVKVLLAPVISMGAVYANLNLPRISFDPTTMHYSGDMAIFLSSTKNPGRGCPTNIVLMETFFAASPRAGIILLKNCFSSSLVLRTSSLIYNHDIKAKMSDIIFKPVFPVKKPLTNFKICLYVNKLIANLEHAQELLARPGIYSGVLDNFRTISSTSSKLIPL